jgi:hypothetical protein
MREVAINGITAMIFAPFGKLILDPDILQSKPGA